MGIIIIVRKTVITANVINIPGEDPTVQQEVRRITQRWAPRTSSLKTS
jgi:hypothetical protein